MSDWLVPFGLTLSAAAAAGTVATDLIMRNLRRRARSPITGAVGLGAEEESTRSTYRRARSGGAAVVFPGRPWYSYNSTLKRVLDILVACGVLIATLPIWLAIIIAIKVDSPGPAIFKQERVGLRGRLFPLYKFRSMRGAGVERAYLSEVEDAVFKFRADPRLTRVGRFLRRTGLDELPQLINVLWGEMSLVGPDPVVPEDVAHYRPNDMIRLAVKPGLISWWPTRDRSSADFETWMAYDREYVEGVSFWLDLKILTRALWGKLLARGAH